MRWQSNITTKFRKKPDYEHLLDEYKAKVWFDKLLSEEIDLKTFKTGLDVLLKNNKPRGGDIGYI